MPKKRKRYPGPTPPRNWVEVERHADGRTISWNPDSPQGEVYSDLFEGQLERFRVKFGREPGPDDPIFFDPDADEPTSFSPEQIAQAKDQVMHLMAQAGIDLAKIQAYGELEYMVTEENLHLYTDQELRAWDEAVKRHEENGQR